MHPSETLTCCSRLLFVGPLSPGRRSMLHGLEDLGLQTDTAPSPERAAARVSWSDLVLFGITGRGEMAQMQRMSQAARALAAVLRPEDKGVLAPMSLRAGARSIFVDEVQPEEVFQFARSLNEEGLLRREVRWLRTEVRQTPGWGHFVGSSVAAERLRRAIRRTGRRTGTVVVRGEKGSNFLQVARALHVIHPGQRHPFLHWGAGALRGATGERALARLEGGRGEEGDLLRLGGTLFVEEAQSLPAGMQVRLARAVRAEGVSPDFRLIVGHTQDPERLIQDELDPLLRAEGKATAVRIPPLRDRRKDIPELAVAILSEFSDRVGQERRGLTPAAVEWFAAQPWWGNESELEVALWRAYLVGEGKAISVDDLKLPRGAARRGDMEEFFRERLSSVVTALDEGGRSDFYTHTIRSVEKPLFELVLRECGGNQLKAARLLGMNRNTLRRKLQELGLGRRPSGPGSARRRG